MTTEHGGAAGRGGDEAGGALLVGLIRRFTVEGVERRTALRQVMRAARLDMQQAQALYEAVAAAEVAEEDVEDESDLTQSATADDGAGVGDVLDDLDPTEDEEAPDAESFRGTVRVDDMDRGRRATRTLLEPDRWCAEPHKRVLSAVEEVGLSLLFRAAGESSGALPDDYLATLSPDSEAYRAFSAMRSEERRVGEESRSRWLP